MSLLSDLHWRGLLQDCTDREGLEARLAQGPITVYCGFDPTADSLHVGHLMGQLMLRRFQIAGHHVIPLAGGATGMVGDPSGKSSERNLQTPDQVAHNVACITRQLRRLLDFEGVANPARLVNNATWTAPMTFLEFLREVGKHFPVNVMLAKDSVRNRLSSDSGISYTEFSYMLLQANDFLHLRSHENCELQIGGSDQWGNITAGCDLIRRKLGAGTSAYGLTFPLLTKADGTKFGKTEGGTIWLDPEKTSPYRFYQFFIQSDDAMVVTYLKRLTLLPREQIEALETSHLANPGAREAHQALARAVTTLAHGEQACSDAVRASQILFGGGLEGITEKIFADVVGEVPTHQLAPEALAGNGAAPVDLFVAAGLSPSKGQARKDLESGGLYLNNERLTDVNARVGPDRLLFGKHLLLRKGKRSYAVLSVR
jgi:tyrosyl-tRNA synthetase